MAETTTIEWCDSTWNPWIGCTRVSPACDDCYAARSTPARTLGVAWGPHEPRRRTADANWSQPRRWNDRPFYACTSCAWRGERKGVDVGGLTLRACPLCSGALKAARQRVFCASLADVFDNEVPVDWRVSLFRLIADTPHLDWLLLTKRIGNALPMLRELAKRCGGGEQPMPNVWLGATVVNQEEADRDIPKLLAVPARVRFVSIEPMLGPIDLTDIRVGGGHGHHEFDPIITGNVLKRADSTAPHVHWVIAGGESGPRARPMHPDWARSLRDQCAAAGVPFFFKQWGEWLPTDAEGQPIYRGDHQHLGGHWHAFKVGKKAAGRLLDGVEHNGIPEVR